MICIVLLLLGTSGLALSQTLDGKPYDPAVDPDIDLYLCSWKESMPRHTHGSLIERDVLTRGDAMNPPRKGAVLEYVNRFAHATLESGAVTTPTTLENEQEIFYIMSGKGILTAGGETAELREGIAVLMPANLEFTMKNIGDDAITMYLVNEPTPEGFRPNEDMIVIDELAKPVDSYDGHWCHIVKYLFETDVGLGTLERVLTVSFDPMTIGHPHSHADGCEEVWAAVKGSSVAFIGKEIRDQEPGMAYMIPPDGKTPHANINYSNERIKIFYFARYRDHDVRE